METAFVAIDVETANADRSSICQIGAVRVENGIVTDTFATLVDPETYFDPWNIQIHGITAGMVQGQPAFPLVAHGLSEFVASAVVASHTAFDRLAVERVHSKYNIASPSWCWLDTARVARRAWKEFADSGYGLAKVAAHCGIEFRHHDALEDARAAGQVLVRAMHDTGLDVTAWVHRAQQPIDPSTVRISRENVMREDMHPVDQFEAFRALANSGMPATDIAARFGKTEAHVARILKLARVSAKILNAYRKEELTLEDVMAFAVTDDHDAQERVLGAMAPWQGAREIRAALTENDIAATDRRVKFVTLKAYEKAGGKLKRDLFSDDDSGVFIEDPALLDTLVTERFEKLAAPVRAEGWKWVEACVDFGNQHSAQYRRIHADPVPLTEREQETLDKLQEEYDRLNETIGDIRGFPPLTEDPFYTTLGPEFGIRPPQRMRGPSIVILETGGCVRRPVFY